jgi:putative oxidoreductase
MRSRDSGGRDLGLLILRLTVGGFLAGHGAQKLFGLFDGHGIQGTGRWLESIGLRPGQRWAMTAGLGEFGGGALTALGFLHPIGPIMSLGPMMVAWGRTHWGKPIWVSAGGAELPATNISVALALVLMGPGKFSLDRMLGIRTHPALAVFTGAAVAAGTLVALTQPTPEQVQQASTQEANPAAAT